MKRILLQKLIYYYKRVDAEAGKLRRTTGYMPIIGLVAAEHG